MDRQLGQAYSVSGLFGMGGQCAWALRNEALRGMA